ncbi:prolipoprotein diacylglyceryl transferase [Aquipuribacter sp. SD81]|uniref:prolipoprotein diacylglyceryl transferase n=1 Tax=Aquipuribacter sp. SD81 TaxID=3127703 RepID=UPI0030180715
MSPALPAVLPVVSAVPAGIPYEPFPTIELGPVTIQVFGLCVAVGVLLGGWVTARRNARLGIPTEQTEKIVIALVLVGVVGARLLWVLTNLDQIRSPIDVVAVWDGGLQFSGGFIAALLLSPFLVRNMSKEQRWHLLDGAAIGLAIGMIVGRVGCLAVGEHLGGTTSFPLGITYRGTPGDTVEGPLVPGETYWALPIIEMLYVGVVLLVMLLVDRTGEAGAGTLAGVFSVGYAVTRFASDFLRTYDDTFYGLTGAQYMCLLLFPVGMWFLRAARHRESPALYQARLRAEAATEEAERVAVTDARESSSDEVATGDEQRNEVPTERKD